MHNMYTIDILEHSIKSTRPPELLLYAILYLWLHKMQIFPKRLNRLLR